MSICLSVPRLFPTPWPEHLHWVGSAKRSESLPPSQPPTWTPARWPLARTHAPKSKRGEAVGSPRSSSNCCHPPKHLGRVPLLRFWRGRGSAAPREKERWDGRNPGPEARRGRSAGMPPKPPHPRICCSLPALQIWAPHSFPPLPSPQPPRCLAVPLHLCFPSPASINRASHTQAFHFRRRKQLSCLLWETNQLPLKSKGRDHVHAFQLTALERQAASTLPRQPDPFTHVFSWRRGGVQLNYLRDSVHYTATTSWEEAVFAEG